jgi:hypothetical protein
MLWNILKVASEDQGQVRGPVCYIRYMGCFSIAMMHTKLIRMKRKVFWDILVQPVLYRSLELIRCKS